LQEFEQPGEVGFVAKLIKMFLEDLATRLEEMDSALACGNARRINRAAHALKGASGELGAARLRDLCGRLEAHTAGESVDGAEGLIRPVAEEAARVRIALAGRATPVPINLCRIR
jgi:HPt (histidine-containing phosphotransfer) domain-containing protein